MSEVNQTSVHDWFISLTSDVVVLGVLVYSFIYGSIPVLTTFVYFWVWLSVVAMSIAMMGLYRTPEVMKELVDKFKGYTPEYAIYQTLSNLVITGILFSTENYFASFGYLIITLFMASAVSASKEGKFDV